MVKILEPKIFASTSDYDILLDQVEDDYANLPSLGELIKDVFGNEVRATFLGAGSYGDVYGLYPQGSVLKITTSPAEAYCVQQLFEIQESDPIEFSKYFPHIYQSGFITDNYHRKLSLSYDALFDEKSGDYLVLLPVFWYEREELTQLIGGGDDEDYLTKQEETLWLDRISEKISEVKDKFGINLLDANRLANWGLRKYTDDLIFQDLVCATEDVKYDDRDQWKRA